MALQHLRSSTANKRPTPAAMSDGQLAVNTNTNSPGLFFKDSAGALIKVGPVHVGTTAPNASPASGGETGNTVGEQWLDTAGGTYVFKVWDGSAWRSESGTFVDVNGDVMTGALGIIAGSAGSPGLYFSGDTNTGLYSPGADQVAISTGGSGRLFVDASGNVGVQISSPAITSGATGIHVHGASAGGARLHLTSADTGTTANDGTEIVVAGNDLYIDQKESASTIFYTNGSERARIDSSGRLLVGTSSMSAGATAVLQGSSTSSAGGSVLYFQRGQAAASISNGDLLGRIFFADNASSTYAAIEAFTDGIGGAGDYPGRLVFSTTADGASSPTERMRISQSGNLSVGVTSDSGFHELRKSGGSETSAIAAFSTSGSNYPVAIYQVTGAGANGAAAAMLVGRGSVTSRSINAGGTVNASGADYAEYMIKAGDFTIAKGDVCGVTADGQLTNEFADAVSFVVKSTNPSYVGGDTWGSEDVVGAKPEAGDADALVQWEADLEAARQAVDRIAFAGQVPVNVMGATPGQYIVPVQSADGGIEGIAKKEADLTLAEYMRAVGKVIATEDDGRARIIVKVA